MTEGAARARIDALRTEIREHDRHYFVENDPRISDQQYDGLMRTLRDLEERFPKLRAADSPTQRVGERPIEGFEQVRHTVPMLSIDNTYAPDELREWADKLWRYLEDDESAMFVVDPKIDGVAVALQYERGVLQRGATRGDGETGDDITQNIRPIRSVPLRLIGDDVPDVVEIRGEVYWPRADFERVNHARVAEDLPAFANPRNATAGTLKQLDTTIVASRQLAFQMHGFGEIEPFPAEVRSYVQLLERLRDWGVPTSPHTRQCASIDEVLTFVEQWDSKRQTLGYETDGLVIKVDDLGQRTRLGATSKAPRWCIAYKFAAERGTTRIASIDFQVGKLGTITPVANLEPVALAGTTVRRATLHNFDQVERLDLHHGDTVHVEKAGEIIPQVVGVDTAQRAGDAIPVKPPTKCPACDGPVVQDEGGVYLRCTNARCPAQLVERLKFFCGRGQMDIEGAGSVLVETLVREALVAEYADLYRLADQRERLLELERMGEKSVDNLLNGIAASKMQPLARVLAALSIPLVGENTAELIANHFGDVDALVQAEPDAVQEIDGVGPEVARSLHGWLHSDSGQQTIGALRAVGVNLTQPRDTSASGQKPLQGKILVVTGTLERYGRKEIEALIKRLGGKTTGSVSKKTDYLVVGASPGSKFEKAQKLNVTVLNEAEFDRLIAQ